MDVDFGELKIQKCCLLLLVVGLGLGQPPMSAEPEK